MKVYIFHYIACVCMHVCVYDCGCSSQKTIPGIGPDLSPQLKQGLSFASCRIPQASWPTGLQKFFCLPSLWEHQHRKTLLCLASAWDLGIQTQALHWQENLLHTEPSPQTSSYFCGCTEDGTLAISNIRQALCYRATSLARNKHCQSFSCDA